MESEEIAAPSVRRIKKRPAALQQKIAADIAAAASIRAAKRLSRVAESASRAEEARSIAAANSSPSASADVSDSAPSHEPPSFDARELGAIVSRAEAWLSADELDAFTIVARQYLQHLPESLERFRDAQRAIAQRRRSAEEASLAAIRPYTRRHDPFDSRLAPGW